MEQEQQFGAEQGIVQRDAGAVVVGQAAREQSELQSALILARRFPRDEGAVIRRLHANAQRVTFADDALYSFQRAGNVIEGPSVYFTRETARIFGNMRSGIKIVDMTDSLITVRGWAMDLETNAYSEREAAFKPLIYRRTGGWQKPDERDLRELVNKNGAICVRNALLDLLPTDIVDEALRLCKVTSERAALDPARVLVMLKKYLAIGVTEKMLAAWGKVTDPKLLTPAQFAELGRIYKTITDGAAVRADFFPDEKPTPTVTEENVGIKPGMGAVNEEIKKRHAKPAEPPANVNLETGEILDDDDAGELTDADKQAIIDAENAEAAAEQARIDAQTQKNLETVRAVKRKQKTMVDNDGARSATMHGL